MTPFPPFLWLSVLLASLAAWAAVETWRDGSLFDSMRARLQVRRDLNVRVGKRWWFQQLLLCPFCLVHWTALACSGAALACWATGWEWLWLPLHWLASVKLAVLGLGHVGNPLAKESRALADAAGELEALAGGRAEPAQDPARVGDQLQE